MKELSVSNDGYFVVQGWMRNVLKLKGNELIIFAIIWGFSQTNSQVFNGKLSYLMEWTGATKQSVINTLNNLQNRHLIIKNIGASGSGRHNFSVNLEALKSVDKQFIDR